MKQNHEFWSFYKLDYVKNSDLYPILLDFEITWLKGLNGHDHGQDCKLLKNIPYYTLNAVFYNWHGLKIVHPYPEEIGITSRMWNGVSIEYF